MHHRSLGREELRRAGSLVFPNSDGTDQRGGYSTSKAGNHVQDEENGRNRWRHDQGPGQPIDSTTCVKSSTGVIARGWATWRVLNRARELIVASGAGGR